MPVEKTNNYFPLLRFPAFQSTEQWKTKKLGDIAELYAGATPSTSVLEYWTEGTIPWMSSGEVHNGQIFETEKKITTLGYDRSSTKMVPANTVIVALAGQGKTRGSVAITRISLCTNQSLCSILPNETYDSDYLYFFLKSQYETLRFISSGDGTRGGLNLQMLRDFLIPFPSLEEQHIIALFLSSIDSFISSINGKVEQLKIHKKSLMQKLFPQKGQTVPEFRFPEFEKDGAWEEKELGKLIVEIAEFTSRRNNVPLYSLTIEDGVSPKTDRYERNFLVKKEGDNFKVVHPDDFVSNPMNLRFGAIGYNKESFKVCVSGYYDVFRFKDKGTSSFWINYMKSNWALDMYDRIAIGSLYEKRRVHFSNLLRMKLLVPKYSERLKISEYLSSMDEVISLYSKKASLLEQHKKGLMQQLFPKA